VAEHRSQLAVLSPRDPEKRTLLKLDRPADFALKALTPEDRDVVNGAVSTIRQATSNGTMPLSFGRYPLKALADGLRLLTVDQRFGIFFRKVGEDIVILDIFPVARLEAMRHARA
jgi:hypothetical protein